MASKIDLNQCTSRQLSSIPGINESLADAIVATRRTRKKFQHIDQLWKVSGMTRVKFRILLKYTEVVGQSTQPVGTVPYYVPSKQFVAVSSSRPQEQWKTPRMQMHTRGQSNGTKNLIEVSGVGKNNSPLKPSKGGGRSVPASPVSNQNPAPARPNTAHGSTPKTISTKGAKTPSGVQPSVSSSAEQKPVVLHSMYLEHLANQRQRMQQGKGRDTQAEDLAVSKSGNRLTLTYRFDEDRVNIPNTVILRATSTDQDKQGVQPKSPIKNAWESPMRDGTNANLDKPLDVVLVGQCLEPKDNAIRLSSHNLAMHEAALSEKEEAPRIRQRSVETWVESQSERPFRASGPGSTGPKRNIKSENKPESNTRHTRQCSPRPPSDLRMAQPRSPAYSLAKPSTAFPNKTRRADARGQYQSQDIQGQQATATYAEYGENYDEESVTPPSESRQTITGSRQTKSPVRDGLDQGRHPRRSKKVAWRRSEEGRKRHRFEDDEPVYPKKVKHKANQVEVVMIPRFSPPRTRSRSRKGKCLVRGTAPNKTSVNKKATPMRKKSVRVYQNSLKKKRQSPKRRPTERKRSPRNDSPIKNSVRSSHRHSSPHRHYSPRPRSSPAKHHHGHKQMSQPPRQIPEDSAPKSGEGYGGLCYVM